MCIFPQKTARPEQEPSSPDPEPCSFGRREAYVSSIMHNRDYQSIKKKINIEDKILQ